MKLVGYCRVSTDRQVEEGFGLAVQHQAVRAWAKRNNHRLIEIVADEGVSGIVAADERPALAWALNLISDHRAEGLLIPRLDRLARSLAVQEATLAHVWKHRGKVFCADSGEIFEDDPEDPARTAMRQVMGVFSQLERSMISERLRAGRRVKAEQGGYAYGAPSYGFKAENKALIEDDYEQRALHRISELMAEGQSLRAICDRLHDEGIKPKRSDRWHPGTIVRITRRLASGT